MRTQVQVPEKATYSLCMQPWRIQESLTEVSYMAKVQFITYHQVSKL